MTIEFITEGSMALIRTDESFAEKFIKETGDKAVNIKGFLRANVAANVYTDGEGRGIVAEKSGIVQIYSDSGDFVLEAQNFLSDKEYFYSNVEKSVAEILLKNISPKWTTYCRIMKYGKPNAPKFTVPKNAEVRPIDLKWLDLINDNYTYKDEYSREKIKEEITSRPSCAVYVDGKPVAWNLIHSDYSMGAMFVQPEYRGNGYAYIAAASLIGMVLAEGMTPYVQIVSDNVASLSLAAKLGFTHVFDAYFFEG